ncbi:MAG: hypothetical protein IKI49_02330, partial [Oscillospiraceae bacterium]|nr:hypothetical protein [Oscillospiraceae bacterium]
YLSSFSGQAEKELSSPIKIMVHTVLSYTIDPAVQLNEKSPPRSDALFRFPYGRRFLADKISGTNMRAPAYNGI